MTAGQVALAVVQALALVEPVVTVDSVGSAAQRVWGQLVLVVLVDSADPVASVVQLVDLAVV